MISYFQAIVIGLIQGVTELFPISSLGHSVLVPAWLGWDRLVTAQSADEGAISPDGTKVAFRSGETSGGDLWVAGADGREVQRLTTGNLRPRQLTWSKRISGAIYFLDRAGALRIARTSVPGLPPGLSPGASEPARLLGRRR